MAEKVVIKFQTMALSLIHRAMILFQLKDYEQAKKYMDLAFIH